MTTRVRWRHTTAQHVSIITTTYPVSSGRSLTILHVVPNARRVTIPARPFTALKRERAFAKVRHGDTRLVPRRIEKLGYDVIFDGTARDPGLFVWGLISLAFICVVVATAYLASSGIKL